MCPQNNLNNGVDTSIETDRSKQKEFSDSMVLCKLLVISSIGKSYETLQCRRLIRSFLSGWNKYISCAHICHTCGKNCASKSVRPVLILMVLCYSGRLDARQRAETLWKCQILFCLMCWGEMVNAQISSGHFIKRPCKQVGIYNHVE